MPRKQKHLQVVKFRTKPTLFKIQPCICLLVMLNLWLLPNYSLKNLDFINNYNNLDGKKMPNQVWYNNYSIGKNRSKTFV